MGGSHNIGDDDWELASGSTAISTLVLVGKSGTGKSATGNSILGRKAFKSYNHRDGVTTTCEMQSTILNDGRTVNVIDTPGLFDLRHGSEFVGKEIVRCMDLAKDGIHAILVVFSARTRFSPAEEASIKSLQTLFGDKITDHVIVVFTGGDDFEDDGTSLKDYLSRPEQGSDSLQEFIRLCKYRVVLFDNRTKDIAKQTDQLHVLFSHVDSVVAANDGKPYSDQVIAELKEGSLRTQDKVTEIESLKESKGYTEEHISDLKNQIYKSYDDQLVRITAMVEQKLQASVERLEKQLADEQAAREQAIESAKEAQLKSSQEINELRESLKRAQRESEEFRRRAEEGKCTIL